MGGEAEEAGEVEVEWEEEGVSGIDGDGEDMVLWLAAIAAGTGLGGDVR